MEVDDTKASELINRLIQIIAEEGDMDVQCFNLYDSSKDVDYVDVHGNGTKEWIIIAAQYK
jgi:hypothetical protein